MPANLPLSPNEIRDRALKFAHEWRGERRERAEAQTFWNEFFNVFGVSRKRLASFEEPVKHARRRMEGDTLKHASHAKGEGGFIDLLWKGTLIAEHKSAGKDLDTAYQQALDYFDGLIERDLPRYVIVSDFARIRLYDLEESTQNEFPLADLHKHIGLFGFIAGYTTQRIREQDPVNIKAAEKMGRLHDQLKAGGYAGHNLEVLLVRLLFCLFAEDTTIFSQKDQFRDWLETCTREDGSDLGSQLELLFQVLNTKEDQRQKNLDERFGAFPYVNGKLFEERLNVAAFTSGMRTALFDCCALDWGRISPAIFGALFQSVMDDQARRNLGAHYTSEKNILKLVKSLFLDELRTEFDKVRNNRNRLFELHKKIAALKFLDPACGCGNFLVIAYRELRLLELDILRAMLRFEQEGGQRVMDVIPLINVNVDQFHGIELEEFPAQIAQVALWLMDHQMNMRVSEEFGFYYRRLPLTHAATIRCANALRIDWNEVISAERVDYILGNPPFVGKQYQSKDQKQDMESVCHAIPSYGLLDYVAAWYVKTVQYLKGDAHTQDLLAGLGGQAPKDKVKIAFVSTNSITQGEQVAVLWSWLLGQGVKIHFAHRTFQWRNEARGMAAVHCVIIGFALFDAAGKRIFDYPDIKGDPHETAAANINPYLVDAADIFLTKRDHPLADVPPMLYGSKPVDGGNVLFNDEEKKAFIKAEPGASKYMRQFMGADEFLYGVKRWCLWLKEVTPQDLRAMPLVRERVEAVRAMRAQSVKAATIKFADYPTLFGEDRQPSGDYLIVPEVSSERRAYLPVGFVSKNVISSNLNYNIQSASRYIFGMVSSSMHMAWVRYVAGRLESRYRYSSQIVYNNFPWPELPVVPLSPRERGRGEGCEKGEGKTLPPKEAIEFARNLRQHSTDAEQRLWALLRNRHLGGFKFRRQHPLPPYTLDFYCEAAKLAVELDGGQHVDDAARDRQRDAFLKQSDIHTLRVWNNQVFGNLEGVLEAIWNALNEQPSPPAPLPEGEGSKARGLPEGDGSKARGLPEGEGSKLRAAIEIAAQDVLDARKQFPEASLADLYDPVTMPPALRAAHTTLDRTVDAAYGKKNFNSDAERVAFLFDLYQKYTTLLPAAEKPKRARARKK